MEAEQITEADFPPQAKENWLLNVNTNLFFWLALMTSKDSLELVNKAFSQIGDYFKPCNPVIATDVYRIALQLPIDFTKAFFNSFEPDAVRYSEIISSIESNQEKEFLACFHECDIESFGNHYYSFIKLALSFFMVYSGQSIALPHISDYIDYDSKCVKILS